MGMKIREIVDAKRQHEAIFLREAVTLVVIVFKKPILNSVVLIIEQYMKLSVSVNYNSYNQ